MSKQTGFDHVTTPFSPDMHERLASKASSVGQAMRQRLAAQWTEGEIDLLFLHYLYGVVMAAVPEAGIQQALDLLGDLAAPTLDTAAVDRGLHAIPEAAKPLFVRALETAETIGRRDAESIRAETSGDRGQLFETNGDNRVPNAPEDRPLLKDRWK